MKEANEIKNQEEFEKEYPKQINYIVEQIFQACLDLADRFKLEQIFVVDSVCSKIKARKRKELL